jgi:hypothetical protein
MAAKAKQEFPPLYGPGFYPMAVAEVQANCVAAFPLSATRKPIMEGLENVLKRLNQAKLVGNLWVDGSFLTQKIDPEDVDLLLCLKGETFEPPTDLQRETEEWYSSRDRKETHHCDTYTMFEYDKGHRCYGDGEADRAYWIKQYGRSRGSDLKGIIVIRLTGAA